MKKCLIIRIRGRVQGVFFRDSAKGKADEFNIKGFVRNEPDGSVCVEAEGELADLERFLAWCKEGSGLAKVEKVETEEAELKNFPDFKII